jgi:hypothetical protein
MIPSVRCGSHKEHVGTHYAKLVFLHTVDSVGHVVRSGASGVRNVDTLFFMLGWAQWGSTKCVLGQVTPNLCFSTRWDLQVQSAFCCIRSVKHQCTIFHTHVRQVRIPQKSRKDTLR